MDELESSNELADRSPKRFKIRSERSVAEELSDGEKDGKEVIGARKWEDLPINCLVDMFGRLSLQDLTLGVPFVCKSWYEALLDPACWKTLDFRAIDPWACSPFHEKFKHAYHLEKFTFRGFLKLVISHSQKSATKLLLSEGHFPLRDLVYVCKECPLLHIYTAWDGKLDSGTTPIRGLVLKMNDAILKYHCKL